MFKKIFSRARSFQNYSVKEKFTRIYKNNLFFGDESRSGKGSGLIQTERIRSEIPKLLTELNIRILIDSPCGDLFWMKEVELPVDTYIGIDIVDEIISTNTEKYGNHKNKFLLLDIIKDVLPSADMILCRDCLVHLSFEHSMKVIHNFKKSGAKYLLTTTFTTRRINKDLYKGVWRTLNLELPPFNFPAPLMIINEGCTEYYGRYSDKSLGLWLLEEIDINQEHSPSS